jgi:hypothetical protein
MRLHIGPKDNGTHSALGALAADVENAAGVLALFQAGCM